MNRTALATVALLFSTALGQADRDRARERDGASEDDTDLVAQTRMKLTKSVDVEWKDTRLRDCLTELEAHLDVEFYFAQGASPHQSVTFSGKARRAKGVLHEIFKDRGLGYVIHRKATDSDRYEGRIDVIQGDQRGDEPHTKHTPP